MPSRSILTAARTDPAADLIVIGTRGLTGIRHLLLGSTAERVVKNSKCPVLSIHPEDVEKHRPLQTILVPTDFSEDAELAIAGAIRLLPAGVQGARLILLHAYHLPFEYTAYGAIPTSFDYLADAEGEALEQLKSKAAELAEEGFEVEILAKEGYPPDVIVEEAKKAGADLITMGTQGRSAIANLLLGSTAERVVQHAECPVLTVPRLEE
jgi:nucleotide-binding universal stress UspA family protein